MLNAHNVLQRGLQTAFGTANATATAKLQSVGSFALTPELQTRSLSQLRGTLAPAHQTALDMYMSNATFEVPDETFEDINYWFESLFSSAAPSGSGPYVRAYAAPTTAEAAPKFMTLQYGQTGKVWQMNDASIANLTLSGANNTGIQVGGSLIGGKAITGALASLTDRTSLTRITGCQAALAIDAWGTAVGTTAVADSAFSWELTINPNRQYRAYLGSCTPTAWNDQPWTGQLRLSLELNDTTDNYIEAILAAASTILERQIQIQYTNSAEAAALRTLTIQFAGHTLAAPQLFQDRNGVTTYDLVFEGVYNPTMANWLKVETKSGAATLV
jgi:hypothetical protein